MPEIKGFQTVAVESSDGNIQIRQGDQLVSFPAHYAPVIVAMIRAEKAEKAKTE